MTRLFILSLILLLTGCVTGTTYPEGHLQCTSTTPSSDPLGFQQDTRLVLYSNTATSNTVFQELFEPAPHAFYPMPGLILSLGYIGETVSKSECQFVQTGTINL
jgi:hypothetical protein